MFVVLNLNSKYNFMKIYIFKYIDQVSNREHSGGGLVIIAKDIESAIGLVAVDKSIEITDKDWSQVESYELNENAEPKYWVMPDSGCC